MSPKTENIAMQGAKTLVAEAESMLERAAAQKGARTPVSFPDTSYYLPTILAITGKPIEKISDLEPILHQAREMLQSGPDAGMATLFAAEAMEAIRTAHNLQPEFADGGDLAGQTGPEDTYAKRVHGPICDMQLREWGIELLSGRMPGIAAIAGCARDNAAAVRIIHELRRRNILCFVSGNVHGRSIIHQLQEEGVELGCETRIVPIGTDTTSTVHALGFAARIALMFGGLKPGMSREILSYSKDRLFGFVLALGEVGSLTVATAAGALHFGFPTISDSVASDEHVISMPFDRIDRKNQGEKCEQLVQKCIAVRGMKVKLPNIDVPVHYGPAFEDEVIREAELRVEFGGKDSRCFEILQIAKPDELTDGKTEVIGSDFSKVEPRGSMDMGIVVRVAGHKLQSDFEPLLERQIHTFLDCASGIQHTGQRDHARIRISNAAAGKGFGLESFGKILQARFHEDFGAVVEKVQVTIVTEPKLHSKWLETAREAYHDRNKRLNDLTDDRVNEFYSCTLCQSFARNHVCVISPERLGLCGGYDWLGCLASHSINPAGSIQPIKLGKQIDAKKGLWEGTNECVRTRSHGVVNEVAMYSIMEKPMTACCSSECIVMLIPDANGVMVVSREDASVTPAGMTFSTLACISGGSPQTPGMMGVGKSYLTSPKFISADGGFRRIVWLSSVLKEDMSDEFRDVAAREGDPELLNKIADERDATSVEELLAWLKAHNHPALAMEPMF